jgi:tricorn protease
MTQNGKKLLVRKGRSFYMVPAGTGKASLKDKIDMSGCKFALNPRDDWNQIYKDAWRMERDYFYDKNMHGVDWDAMYEKYLPIANRVTTREELNDVIARLVGELSALHTYVFGGDSRSDNKNIRIASLGANFTRDKANGGFRIDYIYKKDPDYPNGKSPLDDPFLDIREGDIITKVNGKDALTAMSIGELIRNQAGKQVRITLKRGTTTRDVIVKPTSSSYWLRYRDWQYSNRLKVDKDSKDQIGYLHLNAMGSRNVNEFFREFYPIFQRKGLIIDVRYNNGGNIDAFILDRLLRKAWMYWKGRNGEPYWNMHYAFRGHIVVLVNERTASDGEAFAAGFKRLGLGTTIGTRTWGGQIWLNGANTLTDNGRAGAPMFGVYGPEGKWLIEGIGFVPDIELDNLPHESFKGKDAQLEAAIKLLQEKIAEDPRDVPPVPAYPDMSFKNNRKKN